MSEVSNTNPSGPVAGVPGWAEAPPAEEMAAFDSLPEAIRRAMWDAPLKPHCANMRRLILPALRRGVSVPAAAAQVRDEFAKMVGPLARATYGPKHPQA